MNPREMTTGEAEAYDAGFRAAREAAAHWLDDWAYELSRTERDLSFTEYQRNRATKERAIVQRAGAAVRLMPLPVRMSDPA
jgi:hypothetical protein